MSGLTTADLDRWAFAAKYNFEHGGLTLRGDAAEQLTLIQAARLQVALDELPLPEVWKLKLSVGTFGRLDMFTATASYCYSLHHYRENVGKARFCPFEQRHAPTMLEAVLALGDALRSRT